MLDFIFRHVSPFTENTPCSPSSPQLDAFNIFPQQNVSHLNKTDIMDITRSLGPFVWNSKFWLFWIFSHRSCFIGIWCWQRPLAWSAPPQKVVWTHPPPPCPKGTFNEQCLDPLLIHTTSIYNRIDRVNLLGRGLNKKGAKYICQGLTLLLVHLSPHTNLKADTKEGNGPVSPRPDRVYIRWEWATVRLVRRPHELHPPSGGLCEMLPWNILKKNILSILLKKLVLQELFLLTYWPGYRPPQLQHSSWYKLFVRMIRYLYCDVLDVDLNLPHMSYIVRNVLPLSYSKKCATCSKSGREIETSLGQQCPTGEA